MPSTSSTRTGPGPVHAGRAVLAPGPVRVEEVLGIAHRLVPEGQYRGALERVAVLVGVGRHGGDPGDPVVEQRDVVPEFLAEGEDPPAEAAVHVQPDPCL